MQKNELSCSLVTKCFNRKLVTSKSAEVFNECVTYESTSHMGHTPHLEPSVDTGESVDTGGTLQYRLGSST